MADGVLDLDALLAPLAGGDGAGEDVRPDYSPNAVYQRIRGMRAEARAAERALDSGDTNPELPGQASAAWREVKRHGIACIAEKAKDFEVAAWLTEALVRQDGLAGLAAGARLLAELCDRYWDSGFPRLDDEDGIEGRTAPIGGLSGAEADGTVMQPLRRVVLFQRGDGTPVDLFLWGRAEDTTKLDSERKEQRYKQGVPALDTLIAEARNDAARLREAGLAARAAAEAWAALDAALTARLGGDAPSMRRVSEALGAVLDLATRLGGLAAQAAAPPPEEGAAPAVAAPDDAGPSGAPGGVAAGAPAAAIQAAAGALRTREDALRQLEALAEFFKKTEPHSPLAFTLEDLVRRARMPLPDLLAEVLPDPAARKAMLTSLGIRVPEG